MTRTKRDWSWPVDGEAQFALDESSPIRHVATMLHHVAPEGRTVAELTREYHHDYADLSRVRHYIVGIADDDAATVWLINRALERLRPWLSETDGVYRLTADVSELRYNGRPLHLIPPAQNQRTDPGPGRYRCLCGDDPAATAEENYNRKCQRHAGAWELQARAEQLARRGY